MSNDAHDRSTEFSTGVMGLLLAAAIGGAITHMPLDRRPPVAPAVLRDGIGLAVPTRAHAALLPLAEVDVATVPVKPVPGQESIGTGGSAVPTRPAAVTVRPGDTLSTILNDRVGLSAPVAADVVAALTAAFDPRDLQAGRELRFAWSGDDAPPVSVKVSLGAGRWAVARRHGADYVTRTVGIEPQGVTRTRSMRPRQSALTVQQADAGARTAKHKPVPRFLTERWRRKRDMQTR
jgi:hypothetical protein